MVRAPRHAVAIAIVEHRFLRRFAEALERNIRCALSSHRFAGASISGQHGADRAGTVSHPRPSNIRLNCGMKRLPSETVRGSHGFLHIRTGKVACDEPTSRKTQGRAAGEANYNR